MPRSTRRTPRAVGLVVAAATTLTLSGCGGLMTDGGVAATYRDTVVTTDQVQDAVKDFKAAAPQAGFTAPRVAALLALGPRLSQLASQYDAGVSTSDAEQAFSKAGYANPSPAAVQVLQASLVLQNVSSEPGKKAISSLISTADVELNPRYGSWGKGGQLGPTTNNWLKPVTPSAPATGAPATPGS